MHRPGQREHKKGASLYLVVESSHALERAHREAQAGAQDGVDESKCGISATEEAKLARLYEKYGIATADEGGVNLVNSMGR